MFKGLEGYSKVGSNYGGGFKNVLFFNPETEDIKSIIVDDTEYQYGDGMIDRNYTLKELEEMDSMPINEEVQEKYFIVKKYPIYWSRN